MDGHLHMNKHVQLCYSTLRRFGIRVAVRLANPIAIPGSLLASLQSSTRNALDVLVGKARITPVARRLALQPQGLRGRLANPASIARCQAIPAQASTYPEILSRLVPPL